MGEKLLMKGNEALAEGAVRAGCRFFAGYPITPQNEVPEYLSWRLPEVGGTFIQAESEVAAINMLYGASACGARVMTSSSGPGISLKQEGISYISGANLPIFYSNVMRGGPGLGNIAPSQGDYFQVVHFLYGCWSDDYGTISTVTATLDCLEVISLRCIDPTKTGARTGDVNNQTGDFHTCHIGDRFHLQGYARTGRRSHSAGTR